MKIWMPGTTPMPLVPRCAVTTAMTALLSVSALTSATLAATNVDRLDQVAAADVSRNTANAPNRPLAPAAPPVRPTRSGPGALSEEHLPRSLTDAEREYLRENPLWLLRSATDPPTDQVRTPAEYEPMDGIIVAYIGNGSWKDILDVMAFHITTAGNADVHVICPNESCIAEVEHFMINIAGADPDRVIIHVAPLNSIWIRDYGPRYIYEGPPGQQVRGIIDHTYNRPRPLDDAIPLFYSGAMNHDYYKIPLVHGGGNYHLDALGMGYTTRLINEENPGYTEEEIHALWHEYQNLDTLFYDPYPSNIDSTQHIDMWMQVIADDKVVISTWPANPGSIQQQICDDAAEDFESRGFTVYRTPARRVSGTHYTYTNVTMCNDIVLIPRYTNSTIQQYNNVALAVWQEALPEHEIIQINSQAIVTSAGVLHCIMMHLPAHPGGDSPTALIRYPQGGEVLQPEEIVEIRWSSDDRGQIVSVDLHLSLDGGGTFDEVIAGPIPDSGSFSWTVPDVFSEEAVIRVTIENDIGNVGYATSNLFTIDGEAQCKVGDLNCDGVVDGADLGILLANWGACDNPPECDDCIGDLNGDCVVDGADLGILLANWG